jgi:hypothetical protein
VPTCGLAGEDAASSLVLVRCPCGSSLDLVATARNRVWADLTGKTGVWKRFWLDEFGRLCLTWYWQAYRKGGGPFCQWRLAVVVGGGGDGDRSLMDARPTWLPNFQDDGSIDFEIVRLGPETDPRGRSSGLLLSPLQALIPQ